MVTGDWTECDVDADGVVIHVHRAGSADRPPLVLSHGLGDSARCWWRVAHALADDFDIVMIDARNHGQSGTGVGGSERLAADVAAVVAHLGLERPSLLGHSIGARTTAEFASVAPGVASRLVLVDPPWRGSDETNGEFPASQRDPIRAWLVWCAGATTDELAAQARQQHPSWPAKEYPTWIESKQQVRPEAVDNLAGRSWGDLVAAIDCPTLLVSGDADPDGDGVVSDAVVQRVTALNPLVESTQITGAGHNIHREQFDRFIEVVRTFLIDDRTGQ